MPLLPDNKVARDRYHVCLKTLSRWDSKPDLKFPAPKVINNRKYRDIHELDAWDADNALRPIGKMLPSGSAAKSSTAQTPHAKARSESKHNGPMTH